MKPVENRQYKDSVFTDLFYSDEGAKERLLSVYNALCGTSYTDPSLVEKVRLDDVLYRNQKNDLACIIKGHTLFLGGAPEHGESQHASADAALHRQGV